MASSRQLFAFLWFQLPTVNCGVGTTAVKTSKNKYNANNSPQSNS